MSEPRNFTVMKPGAGTGCRLVVFPHAGGSALSFARLARALRDEGELWLAELPGHGGRHREPFATSLAAFARECAGELAGAPPLPTIFFGHSMGALAAFECAHALRGTPAAPRSLMPSSCRAPGEPHGPGSRPLALAALDDDATLVAIQREYGAFGPEIGSPLLKDFFLPLLRSDLRLIAAYRPSAAALPIPLHVVGGADDPVVSPAMLEGWRPYTEQGCSVRLFPGGHFYPLEAKAGQAELAEFLRGHLRAISSRAPAW